MSQPEKIIPVKLFAGLIYSDEKVLDSTRILLGEAFGEIDYRSKIFLFSTPTHYYEKEMGNNLKKIFFSFKKPVNPSELSRAKNITFEIEKKFETDGKRSVNIDPGYIDFNKVVLGSYKYGSQKIYIGENVWADITLFYEKGSFKNFPWTFPDFKDDRYYKALFEIRQLLKEKSAFS